ncbi:MAG: hypothetical protein U5K76_04095 [Woeseiaceae bacterium]|nr:hypothetical protein [Woeseiaceae bacterium]
MTTPTADDLQCYRCGASLAALTLPLSRQDLCPDCGNYLHVCRLCVNYDPRVARQCREDDAEEVMDKEKANFCDWFEPAPGRYDDASAGAAQAARRRLDSLFGDSDRNGDDGDPDAGARRAAEDLFR